jgi:hypothetical protein
LRANLDQNWLGFGLEGLWLRDFMKVLSHR